MARALPRFWRLWARPAARVLAGVGGGTAGVLCWCYASPGDPRQTCRRSLCEEAPPGSQRRRLRPRDAKLTALEVRRYLQEGYLVVPGLFTREEIQVLRDELEDICSGRRDAEDGSAHVVRPEGSRPESGSQSVLRVLFPHNVSPICLHVATGHAAVRAIVGQLVGAHLGDWWDGGVKMMQTMLFVRPLASAKETWHQDEYYIPTRDRSLTAMWVPLEDHVDEHNGCLWVVPASHRQGYIHSMAKQEEGGQVTAAVGVPTDRAVPLRMRAGDAVFFNGYLLHASLKAPEGPGAQRRAFAVHYCSAQTLLPWNLPDVGSGTGDNRRIVLVTGTDPYAADRPVPVPPVRKAYIEAQQAAEDSS